LSLTLRRKVSVEELVSFIEKSRSRVEVGGIGFFVGIVKGRSKDGRKVKAFEVKISEETEKAMLGMVRKVKEKHKVYEVNVQHSVGRLGVGEVVMTVAVAGRRRREVFRALEEIVNNVKEGSYLQEREVLEDSA